MPASQAKTTRPFSVPETTTASEVPFISRIFSLAESISATSAARTIGEAITKETAAAMQAPMMTWIMHSEGVMARKAKIDPGEAAEVRPQPVKLNHAMAAALPQIGAMMAFGFMSTYGK